jgi:hypothetical protein
MDLESLKTEKEQAKLKAVELEILQVFKDLKARVPVMKADVLEDEKVL